MREICPKCGIWVNLTNQHGREYRWGKCPKCKRIIKVKL